MFGAMRRCLGALALAAVVAVAHAAELTIGDPAPAWDVQTWVKGDAVDPAALKGKAIILLDFFSVQEQGADESIKKLNALQSKYPTAVKVVALGRENQEEVKEYAGKHEFKYVVGVDNLRNTSGEYGAAGGIFTVLIDKEGRLVWIGGRGDVDGPLERLVAGKFDLERAKKTIALERELTRIRNTGDAEKIGPAADALLAHEPSSLYAVRMKQWCFAQNDDAKGWREFIAAQVPKITESSSLNDIAWRMVLGTDLEWRDAGAMLAAAKRAADLTQSKDASILDTLARVYSAIGQMDRAVETQKKAISALPADADEEEKKAYGVVLAYYESCVALGPKSPAPPAKPPGKK